MAVSFGIQEMQIFLLLKNRTLHVFKGKQENKKNFLVCQFRNMSIIKCWKIKNKNNERNKQSNVRDELTGTVPAHYRPWFKVRFSYVSE